MLVLTAGFFLTLTFLVGVGMFLLWAWKEHQQARLWRTLMVMHQERLKDMPMEVNGPHWKVTIKVGRKTEVHVARGATEADALLELVKTKGVRYDQIVSSIKG